MPKTDDQAIVFWESVFLKVLSIEGSVIKASESADRACEFRNKAVEKFTVRITMNPKGAEFGTADYTLTEEEATERERQREVLEPDASEAPQGGSEAPRRRGRRPKRLSQADS